MNSRENNRIGLAVQAWLLAVLLVLIALYSLSCYSDSTAPFAENAAWQSGEDTATSDVHQTGVLIHEDEIATLPAWQQEKFSDPGWNQPYIEPREPTIIEPPSYEMLMAETRKALETKAEIQPRGFKPGRQPSWKQTSAPAVKGEFDFGPPDVTPQYGCNSNGNNSSPDGNAIEDVIAMQSIGAFQPLSYVITELPPPSYFYAWDKPGRTMYPIVAQLFSNGEEWRELIYRPDSEVGIGPGGVCSPTEIFLVEDYNIWRCFNRDFNTLPGLSSIKLFDALLAPSGPQSPAAVSSGQTAGYYQPFYFGNMESCYGGAWIISLQSTESECQNFRYFFTSPDAPEFFTRPVYGLLLKRWQEMMTDNMAGAWETQLGWPVFGPTAWGGGSPRLTSKGTYYEWSMWFERGYISWVDYDQETYPNATDEAQAYAFTGSNVYCPDSGYYVPLPTTYYGGEGDLQVSVALQGLRYEPADPWVPVPFTGKRYHVPLQNNGLDTVEILMLASGTGGTPDDDCNYKHYVWAFRNGTIQAAGAPFDPAQRKTVATYGSQTENREGMYVVRVQITDADDNIAYRDSHPIVLGHGDLVYPVKIEEWIPGG